MSLNKGGADSSDGERIALGGLRGHTLPANASAAASARVRAAMAGQRARDVRVSVEQAKSKGAVSLREIAAALTVEGITAPRGGAWSASQIKGVIE